MATESCQLYENPVVEFSHKVLHLLLTLKATYLLNFSFTCNSKTKNKSLLKTQKFLKIKTSMLQQTLNFATYITNFNCQTLHAIYKPLRRHRL